MSAAAEEHEAWELFRMARENDFGEQKSREMTDTPKPRRGRPPGSKSSDRDEMIRARCTPEQRATFERLGGADWLRRQLDLLQVR